MDCVMTLSKRRVCEDEFTTLSSNGEPVVVVRLPDIADLLTDAILKELMDHAVESPFPWCSSKIRSTEKLFQDLWHESESPLDCSATCTVCRSALKEISIKCGHAAFCRGCLPRLAHCLAAENQLRARELSICKG